MRHFLVFSTLFISSVALCQTKSLFIGEWQFFDKDNAYYEWTVTSTYIYQYSDSFPPTRQKIVLTDSTLTISQNGKWSIKKSDINFILVERNNYYLKLFPKQKNADTVKSLYDFLQGNSNGNASTIFMRDATERKKQLIERTKNGM